MPTGKRASMREGPLAALFRKTAQDVEDRTEGQQQSRAPQPEPEAPAGDERAEPAAPPTPGELELDEPRIPLPHERLRHAFSADIPENVLDRPARAETPPREPDVYARTARAGEAREPDRTLGPVLRVVGVGGAG